MRPRQGSSGHVCDLCVVAPCLSAETSRLKQRSQVQYQECRDQVCRNQHQRQLCHRSRGNGSVKIGSEQWDERPDTHSHGKVQNSRKVPGHKALARRKTGPTQDTDVVVDSGLNAGDAVIVDGVQKVRPGQVVNATPSAPTAEAKQ